MAPEKPMPGSRRRASALVALALFGGACGIDRTAPPAEEIAPAGPAVQAPANSLDTIPEADPKAVAAVESLEQWRNPFIVVRPAGAALVTAGASPAEAEAVPVERIRERLLALPREAWPLGRIVAVQEVGVRSEEERAAVRQNRGAVKEMLESLGVEILWWPAA